MIPNRIGATGLDQTLIILSLYIDKIRSKSIETNVN